MLTSSGNGEDRQNRSSGFTRVSRRAKSAPGAVLAFGLEASVGPGGTPPKSAQPHASESSQPGARSSSPGKRRAGWFTAADGKWPDWPRNLRSPRAGSSHVSMVMLPVRHPAFLVGKTCPAKPRDPGRSTALTPLWKERGRGHNGRREGHVCIVLPWPGGHYGFPDPLGVAPGCVWDASLVSAMPN